MNTDIKRAIMKIASEHGKTDKEGTCQYKARGGGAKHCTITTNKSCRRCNFYQPTTPAVFVACESEIKKARELVNAANENIDAIKEARAEAIKNAAKAASVYESIKDAAAKMSLASDIVTATLWADSINSYE